MLYLLMLVCGSCVSHAFNAITFVDTVLFHSMQPHLSLFAASEDERNYWVRAIQDALAPKPPLPRSCHSPRPKPSPSCIPEDAAPAPKPSPQRLSASTRYNAALNYLLTQSGKATHSAPEFIPENYSALVQGMSSRRELVHLQLIPAYMRLRLWIPDFGFGFWTFMQFSFT